MNDNDLIDHIRRMLQLARLRHDRATIARMETRLCDACGRLDYCSSCRRVAVRRPGLTR